MTEAELRQVQQQQEAFQQHLLNMQRHLLEQSRQPQESSQPQQEQQQCPTSIPSTSCHFKKRTKVSYHDLQRDDDQAQIAELIENDPYIAAAMEDFVQSHGLLDTHRHRLFHFSFAFISMFFLLSLELIQVIHHLNILHASQNTIIIIIIMEKLLVYHQLLLHLHHHHSLMLHQV